ncbi:MAG: helix-turn-helix transcriptional regulator [Polyangiaceae bacterium]|nr:helix-turn-helix transcriptional regulator [Polyangiaceae bacterium]
MRTRAQLHLLRLSAKLTQARLARKCGVTQPIISMWISGRRKPTYDNRKTLFEQCGIALDDWDRAAEDSK